MYYKHDITNDNSNRSSSSNNINHYYNDYYEIRNDTTTNSTNNDFNILYNIYGNSHSNNNNNINNTSNNNNNSSSNNNNNSCNTSDYNNSDINEIADFVLTFYKYYVPILVCTGSIGNIFSIIVFFKKKQRKLSSSYYLAALAISDTCFLFVLFVNWLNGNYTWSPYKYDLSCKVHSFLTSLSWFCSCWFVVAFTFERFIAVLYPLKRQTMCTARRAKIVLLGLTIVGCIHCTPFWVVSESQYLVGVHEKYFCNYKPKYEDIMVILNYWDSFIVFAVPFILIAILNTWTGCNVWKFADVQRSLTMQKRKGTLLTKAAISSNSNVTSALTHRNSKRLNSSCSHHSGENFHLQHHHGCTMRKHSAKQKSSNSNHTKVTKMLMVVSTVFVCLNLPSCVMRIKAYLQSNKCTNSNTTDLTYLLQHIFELFFITNFGINFVLYCVSGQNFRKEVLNMFRRRSQTQREGTTIQLTVSEYRTSGGGNGTSARRRQAFCWNELRDLQTKK